MDTGVPVDLTVALTNGDVSFASISFKYPGLGICVISSAGSSSPLSPSKLDSL